MKALSFPNRTLRSNGNGAQSIASSAFVPFHSEMDQLLNDMFGGGFGFTRGYQPSSMPAVEVQEADAEYRVTLDLPGVELKDIDLSFNDGLLTLKAERKASEGDARYRTRWSGQLERVIGIGPDVDDARISATLKNGVLAISLPKRPERQPRRIEIQ